MQLGSITAALLLSGFAASAAAAGSEQCTNTTCKAGTHALTFSEKGDPYYACPSKALSDYITTVIGLTAINAAAGAVPNISDKTGEPEYTGATKAIVDGLRDDADVGSFDEAVASCGSGPNKRAVTILNMPAGSTALSAYVMDDGLKKTFWLPISHLDRVK